MGPRSTGDAEAAGTPPEEDQPSAPTEDVSPPIDEAVESGRPASEPDARPDADTGPQPHPGIEGTSEVDAPQPAGDDGDEPESTVDAPGAAAHGDTAGPVENATEPDPAGTSEVEARPDRDPAPEPVPEAQGASVVEASPSAETRVVENVTVQKVGLGAVIAGGAVAALLGGIAGWFLWGQQVEALDPNALDEQAARISELESRLEALPAPPDPAAIAETAAGSVAPRLEELDAGVASAEQSIAALDERIGALDERVGTLERAPSEDGTLTEQAIAAWEQQLQDLRDQLAEQADAIAAQSDRTQTLADDFAAAQEAQAARAEEIEQSAAAAADRAAARGALSRVQAALETGGGYVEPLDEYAQITGDEIPPDLAGPAESGVPSLAALRSSFPDAARAALEVAREEGIEEDAEPGLGSLFRSALQVRSTEPREGSSPDAILSRAEAALADGRLTDALAEVASLPEVVRAAMADWIAAAETRQAAIAAADGLAANTQD